MKRRDFIAAGALLPVICTSESVAAPARKKKAVASRPAARKAPAGSPPKTTTASEPEESSPSAPPTGDQRATQWRTYDLRTHIEIRRSSGTTRLWLPLAMFKDTPWQRTLDHAWQGNFERAGIYRDPVAEMEVFTAEWKEGVMPRLDMGSRIETQDRHFDVTKKHCAPEQSEVLRRNLRSSELMPIGEKTREIAERIVGRIKDPLAQGKVLYDWVAERALNDPELPALAAGGIDTPPALANAIGLNAGHALLFVALARAIGLPARPVFGLRCDQSKLLPSLGASGELNRAFHCRAEFYAPGYDWVPVNPADLRQAVLAERLPASDGRLAVLRKLLFGFWEMNWIGLNTALEVIPRGSLGQPQPFLASAHVETAGKILDTSDSERFGMTITASKAAEA